MRFEPALLRGTLLQRYKRFLADVRFEGDAAPTTVHCPNTGAMTGCATPGSRVWCSVHASPKRKYRHTLELVETPEGRACVNSARANALLAEALSGPLHGALGDWPEIRREVPIPSGGGRFDLALGSPGTPACFVEVKSVTLLRDGGLGAFPDAVSARARRHVQALAAAARDGYRAVLAFVAQHDAIRRVTLAADVDPDYATAVAEAVADGVAVRAFGCRVEPDELRIDAVLDVVPVAGRPL